MILSVSTGELMSTHICLCMPLVFSSQIYHPITCFSLCQTNSNCSHWRVSELVWGVMAKIYICGFLQAKFSPIKFDYLEYFFLRYGEYKKRKEEMLSLTRTHLSSCSTWSLCLKGGCANQEGLYYSSRNLVLCLRKSIINFALKFDFSMIFGSQYPYILSWYEKLDVSTWLRMAAGMTRQY